jgi:hypothetical protein
MQPFCGFVAMTERAEDTVRAGLELDELDASLDRHTARSQVLVQDRLGLCLGDEEQERIGGVLEPDVEEPDCDDSLAGVNLHLRGVVPPLDQRLRDPEPTQHLERARLRERARFVHAIELPVDDPDASAERVELGREREPGRPGANDEHVRVARCRHWEIHVTGSSTLAWRGLSSFTPRGILAKWTRCCLLCREF